jgi:hypothetical protein
MPPCTAAERTAGAVSQLEAGVEEHADANPNTVIAKAKIPIMRAGCAIISITLISRNLSTIRHGALIQYELHLRIGGPLSFIGVGR